MLPEAGAQRRLKRLGLVCLMGFSSVLYPGLEARGAAALEISANDNAKGHRLAVKVKGLRNDRGNVAVALFDSAKAFPDQARAVTGKVVAPSKGEALVIFEGLSPGLYAVAVLHDENANGKMDFNLIGIPTEGYGFSNDASAPFGPPSFEAAAFRLRVDAGEIAITAKYLL